MVYVGQRQPVMEATVARLRAKHGPAPLADKVLLFAGHHLGDAVEFMRGFEALGQRQEHLFSVSIPYSAKGFTMHALRARGRKVPKIPGDTGRTVTHVKAQLVAAIEHTLAHPELELGIVEDGGYVAAVYGETIAELRAAAQEAGDPARVAAIDDLVRRRVKGATEQTRAGDRAYRAMYAREMDGFVDDALAGDVDLSVLDGNRYLTSAFKSALDRRAARAHEAGDHETLRRIEGVRARRSAGAEGRQPLTLASPLGVRTVAASKLKGVFEGPPVAQAVVRNLEGWMLMAGTSLAGKEVLTYGFGTIGADMTSAIIGRGAAAMHVVDLSPRRRAAAVRHSRAWQGVRETLGRSVNVEPGDEASDRRLSEVDVIFGMTGFRTMSPRVLRRVKDGVWLVSGSSKKNEIDVDWLEDHAIDAEDEPWGTRYTLLREDGVTRYTIHLVANGEPVNFFRRPMSLPIEEIDPVYAMLLESHVQNMTAPAPLSPGVHTVPGGTQTAIRRAWDVNRHKTDLPPQRRLALDLEGTNRGRVQLATARFDARGLIDDALVQSRIVRTRAGRAALASVPGARIAFASDAQMRRLRRIAHVPASAPGGGPAAVAIVLRDHGGPVVVVREGFERETELVTAAVARASVLATLAREPGGTLARAIARQHAALVARGETTLTREAFTALMGELVGDLYAQTIVTGARRERPQAAHSENDWLVPEVQGRVSTADRVVNLLARTRPADRAPLAARYARAFGLGPVPAGNPRAVHQALARLELDPTFVRALGPYVRVAAPRAEVVP